MKKPTVTVAIPAYNEEKNIVSLLQSIKNQKCLNFRIQEVAVYSDGSTDNTVELVKKNFQGVRVIDSKKNLGKIRRINQIMKNNTSDILIQIDADVHLTGDEVFENLVTPLVNNNKVGISCAYHLATPPKFLVEKLAYFGFKIWDRARNNLGKKGIRYYCEGRLRAFSNKFTREFRLPLIEGLSEDSYSFFWAITNGFKLHICKDAKLYIDLPSNYRDYAKQMKRFLSNQDSIAILFDKSTFKKYQSITPGVKLKALLQELMKDPLSGLGYICLQLAVYIEKLFYRPQLSWTSIERK